MLCYFLNKSHFCLTTLLMHNMGQKWPVFIYCFISCMSVSLLYVWNKYIWSFSNLSFHILQKLEDRFSKYLFLQLQCKTQCNIKFILMWLSVFLVLSEVDTMQHFIRDISKLSYTGLLRISRYDSSAWDKIILKYVHIHCNRTPHRYYQNALSLQTLKL